MLPSPAHDHGRKSERAAGVITPITTKYETRRRANAPSGRTTIGLGLLSCPHVTCHRRCRVTRSGIWAFRKAGPGRREEPTRPGWPMNSRDCRLMSVGVSCSFPDRENPFDLISVRRKTRKKNSLSSAKNKNKNYNSTSQGSLPPTQAKQGHHYRLGHGSRGGASRPADGREPGNGGEPLLT